MEKGKAVASQCGGTTSTTALVPSKGAWTPVLRYPLASAAWFSIHLARSLRRPGGSDTMNDLEAFLEHRCELGASSRTGRRRLSIHRLAVCAGPEPSAVLCNATPALSPVTSGDGVTGMVLQSDPDSTMLAVSPGTRERSPPVDAAI